MSSHVTYEIREAQFVRFGDGSRTGPTITFRLESSEQLEPFRGEEGQRFALYVVKVLDTPEDNEPAPVVAVPAKPAEPAAPALPKGGRLAREAGIMCNDRAFQRQVERDYPLQWEEAEGTLGEVDGAALAARVLRLICGIDSRAQLDSDADAAEKFTHCFYRPWRDAEHGITP